MNKQKLLAILGMILIFAGCFTPMVHIPIVGNWNYWDLHTGLASAAWMFAVLALLSGLRGKSKNLFMFGVFELCVIILTFVGLKLKVSDSFSFIKFQKLANMAAGLVKVVWWPSWICLLLGAVMFMLAGKTTAPEKKIEEHKA